MNLAQESIRITMKEISNWFERSTKKSENEIELGRIREYQTWTILWSSSALIPCWNQECKLEESSAMAESMQRREGMQRERMNILSFEKNDFVYIKITDSVSLYSRNRATKWPSQAIQSSNTNMTSGLTN